MLHVFKSLVVYECSYSITKFMFFIPAQIGANFLHMRSTEAYLVLGFGEEAPHKRIMPVYFHKPENALNRARG